MRHDTNAKCTPEGPHLIIWHGNQEKLAGAR